MKNKDQLEQSDTDILMERLPKHLKSGDFLGTMEWADDFDRNTLKYKNVFMGYLDILGYKNLIEEYGDDSPQKIFDDILRAFSWAKCSHSSLDVTLFSDTLIITTDDDEPVGFWMIIGVIQEFRIQMLKKGYLVRGSIVHGKHFNKKGIWISPCLIKAYKLESELANVARILIDEDAYSIGVEPMINNGDHYGIVYEKYFVHVYPFMISFDFDGCRVLQFASRNIEVNYLKYGNHPDQANLNKDRIEHCINAGNSTLKLLQVGLKSALSKAPDLRSRSKVIYFINKWNEYCDEFELRVELQEDYKIAVE